MVGVSVDCLNRQNVYNPITGESTIYDEAVIVSVNSNSIASSNNLQEGETFVGITINGERQDFTRYYDLENALLTIREGDNVQLHLETENFVEVTADLGIISSDMLQSVV